ncbi:MAG TPA: O-methyltransferase [Candidatus Onthoplasma faecigallinarum]|nr:O-methyltransferase [Candidatus Onthoplasma faecigallinarum]
MKIDKDIKKYGVENNIPITKDEVLDMIVKMINDNDYKNILEIGTAIGYGSITMANNTNLEHIDTLEIDADRYKIALENIEKAGLDTRIKVYLTDAKDYIVKCDKKYDLIYLDGPKGQYINYLPYLLKILNDDGVIVADNLFFHGMVTGKIPVSKGCRAMIKGLHKYIDEITSSPNLDSKIIEIGDGVGITKKRLK